MLPVKKSITMEVKKGFLEPSTPSTSFRANQIIPLVDLQKVQPVASPVAGQKPTSFADFIQMVQTLKSTLAQTKADLAASQAQLAEKDLALAPLQEELAKTKTEFETSQAELVETKAALAQLRAELADERATKATSTELHSLEITGFEATLAQKEEEFVASQAELVKTKAALAKLLEDTNHERVIIEANLAEAGSALTESRAKLAQESANLQNKIAEYNRACITFATNIARSGEDNTKLQQELAEEKEKYKMAVDNCEFVQAESVNLKTAHATAITELKGKLDTVDNQIENLRMSKANIADLHFQLTSVKAEYDHLRMASQANIEKLMEKLASAQKENSKGLDQLLSVFDEE